MMKLMNLEENKANLEEKKEIIQKNIGSVSSYKPTASKQNLNHKKTVVC